MGCGPEQVLHILNGWIHEQTDSAQTAPHVRATLQSAGTILWLLPSLAILAAHAANRSSSSEQCNGRLANAPADGAGLVDAVESAGGQSVNARARPEEDT